MDSTLEKLFHANVLQNIFIVGLILLAIRRLWKVSDSLFENLDEYSEITDGMITGFSTDEYSPPDGGKGYRLYVNIVYTVNGVQYQTSRFFLHSLLGTNQRYITASSFDEDVINQQGRSYLEKTVSVKYRPEDPADSFVDSTLQVHIPMEIYAAVMFILFLIGVFCYINFF